MHFRRACGGQKLRNIMLDSNIELYGPYVSFSTSSTLCNDNNNGFSNDLLCHSSFDVLLQSRFLLNCAGGGTCGTCMVEVILLALEFGSCYVMKRIYSVPFSFRLSETNCLFNHYGKV